MGFAIRKRSSLFLLAATLVFAGCSDLNAPQQELWTFGSIVLDGQNASETEVDATAMAIFFRSASAAIIYSDSMRNDRCDITNIDTTTVDVEGQLRAGETLSLQISGSQYDMAWSNFFARYQVEEPPVIRYTAGNTVQISVPSSDEFPATSVSVLAAEPLLAPPVATGEGSQPLTVTWNASSNNTTAILLSLRYATSPTVGYGDRQIVCELRDSGQATISGATLQEFRNSPIADRSLTLTRLRSNHVTLPNNNLLHVLSTVKTSVPLQ